VYLGGGTAVSGTFSNIPWGNSKDKFLKAEADLNGGTNYVLMGVSQVVSVPYALQAGTAYKLKDSVGNEFMVEFENGLPILKNKFKMNSNKSIAVCGQELIYENEIYPTILIGNQCWLGKNLNVGELISTALNQTNNTKIEKYCSDDNNLKCNLFGGLYQWAEALNYLNGASNDPNSKPIFTNHVQGICPNGWHIPSNLDFCTLATFLDQTSQCTLNGGNSNSANYLKSSDFWYLNTIANNQFNFSALGAGYRQNNFYVGNIFYETYFWTTSFSSNSPDPIIWELKNYSTYFNRNTGPRFNGYSIRCLKD
jgi:uncharacterized protein (TIGR02145 family)